MELGNVQDMLGGWFIGNFNPHFVLSKDFEVCLKRYTKGDVEPKHFQKIATEVTLIVEGEARMGDQIIGKNSLIRLDPYDEYDFEALTDVTLIAIKFPSLPNDKVLSE